MKVDYKVTTWVRVTGFDEDEISPNELIEKLKTGDVLSALSDYDNLEYETLLDIEEQLSPEENGGCSTIELYDDNDNQVWSNDIKDKEEINYESNS